jgi:acetyl esterase/lipase
MTVLRPRIDWRNLDRTALGEAYNSAAAVANFAEITASWEPRSAAVRQQPDAILDLPYGPQPRNRIDFIKCRAPHAPTLVFMHGGYWQMRAKESFAFVAAGPLATGMNVALVGYTQRHQWTTSLPRFARRLIGSWQNCRRSAAIQRSSYCRDGRRAPSLPP